MKILLHQCCGPCSIYPLSRLIEDGHEPHGYCYNPNIHPYKEYEKRLETLREYNERHSIPYTVIDFYGLRPFINMAETGKSSILPDDFGGQLSRCEGCYRIRLHSTAEYAKNNGFTAFTSTLLYSRHQNHELMKAIAQQAADKHNVEFWYEDYRKGWQVGIDISKQENMYRQNYCGCIYSEEERWLGKAKQNQPK